MRFLGGVWLVRIPYRRAGGGRRGRSVWRRCDPVTVFVGRWRGEANPPRMAASHCCLDFEEP